MRKWITGEIAACLQIMQNGFQMLFEEHLFVGRELRALHEFVAVPDRRLSMQEGKGESDRSALTSNCSLSLVRVSKSCSM